MKQEQKEIEDKMFGRLIGKIIPETVSVEDNIYDVSFDFKTKNSLHRFQVNDRRFVTKLCQLYDISHKNTVRDLRQIGKKGNPLFEGVEKTLKSAVKQNDRTVVLLVDKDVKPISVVSEQHKQLPLSKAFEIIDTVAKTKKAVFIRKTDTGRSYILEYEVGKNRDMSIRVSAYLGRNDALGRAGIHFRGGGNIFVCSNAIIPHIDRDVSFSGKSELLSIKIIHTTNVERNLQEQLIRSFDYAKKSAELLGRKLTQSKSIKMDRLLQKHCVNLIRVKNDLPDTWNTKILERLEKEDESLYGLSQTLTYVASHICKDDYSGISQKLQRMGGQIVLLGKDFVKLTERSFLKKGLEVPKLKVST